MLGAKPNIDLILTKIGLIGYGHWGAIITQILFNEDYVIDKLFTSKKILPSMDHCREIIPISQLNIEAIQSLTHLFVLTGSPFHHALLKKLEYFKPINQLPFILLEKPFITSKLQSDYNPYVEKKLYVDYPYLRENAETPFLEVVDRYQQDSCIGINIFSRYNIQRRFGTVFDFFPHIVSLMNFFVKDFDSLSYYNWCIDQIPVQSPKTRFEYRAIVYSFEAVSDLDGNKYMVRFGIDNPQPSSLTFNKRSNYGHNVDPSLCQKDSALFINLSDAFRAPVNQNIRRFLSTKQTQSLNCTDLRFHDLIYRISANAEFEFSKLQ